MSAISPSPGRPGTVVYDAECGFCTACARWLGAHGTVRLQPWQELDLPAVGLTETEVTEAAWWLPDTDSEVAGEPRRGARAIAAALRTCRGYGWLGRLIDVAPVRPVAAWVYRWVAAHRGLLPGSTDACRMAKP